MKLLKFTFAMLLLSGLLFTSCRTEEDEFIETQTEETLEVNSTVAALMQRVSLRDGSVDNIIDNANCFSVNLPVTVIVNGTEVTVNTEDDYDLIEDILDESDDDVDTVEIVFPITVTLSDYTEVTLNSVEEFLALLLTCPGEDEDDDDIECLDFVYPITATVFNTTTDELETVVIENDEQLYNFLEMIEDGDVINIEFPISVVLADGSTLVIESLEELEAVIDEAEDSCDEDDDYDYDDDDCEDCTTEDLSELIIGCSPWYVDELERGDEDLEDNYEGYWFSFTESGEIIVETETEEFFGTWSSAGSGENITVEIDIPELPDFNGEWNLEEVENEPGDFEIALSLGDDELAFASECDGDGDDDDDDDGDTEAFVAALTEGTWYINEYFAEEGLTKLYCEFAFQFNVDGTAVAENLDGSTPGVWEAEADGEITEFYFEFDGAFPLDELEDSWEVVEFDENIIRLQYEESDGSEYVLVFGREPIACEESELAGILNEGTWIVALYLAGPDNETAEYNGYEIDFRADGTVIAESDTDLIDGTWQALEGDSVLLLDFGGDVPFDEFEEDWDVFSIETSRVELRYSDEGDPDEYVLVFEKL